METVGIPPKRALKEYESLIHNRKSEGSDFLRVPQKKQTRRIIAPLFNRIQQCLLKKLPEGYNIVQTLVIDIGAKNLMNRAVIFHLCQVPPAKAGGLRKSV